MTFVIDKMTYDKLWCITLVLPMLCKIYYASQNNVMVNEGDLQCEFQLACY